MSFHHSSFSNSAPCSSHHSALALPNPRIILPFAIPEILSFRAAVPPPAPASVRCCLDSFPCILPYLYLPRETAEKYFFALPALPFSSLLRDWVSVLRIASTVSAGKKQCVSGSLTDILGAMGMMLAAERNGTGCYFYSSEILGKPLWSRRV